MKSRKFKLGILISIVFMAIAYASVTAILNISGNVILGANDFIVFFKNLSINGKDSYDLVSSTGGSFTLDYDELLSGDLNIDYDIMNRSGEYDANVKVVCSPENASYLNITDNTGIMNVPSFTSKSGSLSISMDPTSLMLDRFKKNEATSDKGYTSLYDIVSSKGILDNIKSDNVSSENGIDFKKDASSTNGNGIYRDNNTNENEFSINYYRGDVTDNNVIFGNLCWKIIRTTETGGTKLIYNGKVNNGTCSGTNTVIESSKFNGNADSATYNGYMYGTVYKNASINSADMIYYAFGTDISYVKNNDTISYSLTSPKMFSTVSEILNEVDNYRYFCLLEDINDTCSTINYIYHATDKTFDYIELSNGDDIDTIKSNLKNNKNSSLIKEALENWYENNLKEYTYYLEDTAFYNDRSSIFSKNASITDQNLYYKSLSKPKFSYGAILDSFSVDSKNGNGTNKYPIGLITVDEAIYAGLVNEGNNNYLIGTAEYWTMSPSGISDLSARNYSVTGNGIVSSKVTSSLGVRPVISLNNQVIVESGDGSSNLPYIVGEKPIRCTLSIDLVKSGSSSEDAYLSSNLYENIVLSSKGSGDSLNFHEIIPENKGVYSTTNTDNGNEVYYYRGDIDTNNVVFANTCWKIIRTTESGETRLLYNGVPSSFGTCDNQGVDATIGRSAFNSSNNDNAYVGYMYGAAKSNSYTNTHSNSNSSNVKQMVDKWYEDNIKDTAFEELVADSAYCNDRSMTNDFSNKSSSLNDWIPYNTMTLNGYGTQNTLYSGTMRVGTSVANTKPSLKCSNTNDRLTTSIGLKYPIGIPSADEMVYGGAIAGVLRYTNDTNPMNKNYFSLFDESQGASISDELHFWTMTPQRHQAGTVTTMLTINQFGYTTNEVVQNERYVRPVITLKSNATILDGNGSKYAPYVLTKSDSKVPVKWQDNGIFSAYYEQAYELMQTMSMDERIAQLLNIGYGSARETVALNKGVAGFTFYAEDFQNKSKEEVQNLMNRLQSSSKIPLMMSVDEEGGKVVRISSNPKLASTPFKSSQELYGDGSNGFEPFKTDTVNKSALLRELGLNVNFAPVVDIASSTSYIYPRTLGQDAATTAKYAETIIEASKGTQVSYCMKHFPGYGNNSDTHSGSSIDETSLKELMEIHVVPFKKGIEAGAETVMISHNTVAALDKDNPASLSPTVHNLLFEDLKFTGIAITDNLDMDAVKNIENKYTKALLAGNNILLIYNTDEAINEIKKNLNNGMITSDQINKLCFKVLAWKYYKGLL